MTRKVKIPHEVAAALERLKHGWSRTTDQDTINLLLLNAVHLARVGDLLVLKDFALKNPTTYIQALANGYEVITIEDQVTEMIDKWLDSPYEAINERVDVEAFSVRLVDFVKANIQKQL